MPEPLPNPLAPSQWRPGMDPVAAVPEPLVILNEIAKAKDRVALLQQLLKVSERRAKLRPRSAEEAPHAR